MSEILKERSELDPQFQWDLTPMFESDAAWETALDSLDADIESLAAFAGKLTDAVTIGAYLDASTEVGRKVERLYCYASQRHDEDTRDDKAQSMYARIGSKYVKMAAALSFAQPEILSLPEETLTAIVNDPAVADYKFNLEDLLRGKFARINRADRLDAGLCRGAVFQLVKCCGYVGKRGVAFIFEVKRRVLVIVLHAVSYTHLRAHET